MEQAEYVSDVSLPNNVRTNTPDGVLVKQHWDPERSHERRYDLALEWLTPVIRKLEKHVLPGQTLKVLQVGGHSDFDVKLRHVFAGLTDLDRTWGDLRTERYGADDRYDLVISMEVVEHLHDVPNPADPFPDVVSESGAKWHHDQCFRALRPDGILFLTTPNATSMANIWQMFIEKMPMFYRPHFREYPALDMLEQLKTAGFEVDRFGTANVWPTLWDGNSFVDSQVKSCLRNAGASEDNRGQSTMILARKPLVKIEV